MIFIFIFARGGAMAVNVSYLSLCLVLILYIILKQRNSCTWHGENILLTMQCFFQSFLYLSARVCVVITTPHYSIIL